MHYIRDKEHWEVDFAILKDRILEGLIEVKYGDKKISGSLKYYARKLRPQKATQIVTGLRNSYNEHGITVIDPEEYFCGNYVWPDYPLKSILK